MSKITIGNKRYDTDTCEVLGETDHYCEGNYAGTTYLCRAADGTLLADRRTNGQNQYLRDYLAPLDHTNYMLQDFNLTDEQEARCVTLGLLELVGGEL